MLRTMVVSIVAALVLTTIGGASVVWAAESQATSITIEGMHCTGCAKKVATRLLAVTGVADAQVNAEKGSAAVTPKDQATLSPRSLWETIEKSGYKPTKLVGPSGTFTKKPEK